MTHNRTLILLILAIAGMTGCKNSGNKYFTGMIGYDYSYSSDSMNADSIAKLRPATGIFRYDEINYQSRFFGKDTVSYYYSGTLNKCLSQTGSRPDYACEDYGLVTDSVLNWKLYQTNEKVLGYSCKILEMQKRNSWVKYYISEELKIAPATYKTHRSYNWDVYGEKADGGLILKMEHRFNSFTMKGTAIVIEKGGPGFKALEPDETKFTEFCNAKK